MLCGRLGTADSYRQNFKWRLGNRQARVLPICSSSVKWRLGNRQTLVLPIAIGIV